MSAIDSEYAADDPLPPSAIGEASLVSHDVQGRFRYGHDADGTHNDPLIPHAWAVFSESGGTYTLEDSVGIDTGSGGRQATGHVRIVLTNDMRSTYTWQVVAWPIYKAGTGNAPLYAYEAHDTDVLTYDKGAADQNTVDVKIVNASGALTDCGFSLAVYGLRSY
jgi:hypothetical protein